jgi:hypothetical protein
LIIGFEGWLGLDLGLLIFGVGFWGVV